MKLIVAVALLLCLSAPCWAQDHSPSKESEVKRLWPGGAYLVTQQQYEHKVISEAELESWLNRGWECVKVYTVTERLYPDKAWRQEEGPVNRAIIRRAKE